MKSSINPQVDYIWNLKTLIFIKSRYFLRRESRPRKETIRRIKRKKRLRRRTDTVDTVMVGKRRERRVIARGLRRRIGISDN